MWTLCSQTRRQRSGLVTGLGSCDTMNSAVDWKPGTQLALM